MFAKNVSIGYGISREIRTIRTIREIRTIMTTREIRTTRTIYYQQPEVNHIGSNLGELFH